MVLYSAVKMNSILFETPPKSDRAIKYLPLSILHIKKCALIKPIFFIIAHTLNTTQIFEYEGQNYPDIPLDISSASHPFLYG